MADVMPPARNRVGNVALVLALVAALLPLAAWIVVAIVGAAGSATVDEAVYAGVIGGMIVFLGVVAALSPVSVAALVLGVVSQFRPGRRAPGVVAIVVGTVGSLGLFGLPLLLSEIVPGF